MKHLSLILKIVISTALIVVLVITADIGEIVRTVSNFNLLWLGPVFFFIVLAVVISAFKWQILLSAQGIHISIFKLFQYYTAGFFFNNFLPSSLGCDGVRVLLLKNEFNSYAGAASSVVMERILATVTLGLLGLIGSVFADAPSRIVVIALGAVAFAGVVLTAVQLTGFVPRGLKEKETKLAKGWRSFASTSADIRKKPLHLVICLVESIAFQMAVAFTQGAIILGLGMPALSLGNLFYVSSASSVVTMIPLTVNGYGFREGGFIYLLEPLGYASSSAFSISILFALFVSAYSLLGAFFWISRKKQTQKQGDICAETAV
jgi:uncharacterized protein (TIRG00374 family)